MKRSAAALSSADQLKRARLLERARLLRHEARQLEEKANEIQLRIQRRSVRAVKKRRWKAPEFDMAAVKRMYRDLYGESWPAGWQVKWVGFMRGTLGLCKRGSKEILLSYGDLAPGHKHNKHGEGIRVLVHEIVHMRAPELRHGREFARLVRAAYVRLGGQPTEIGDRLGTY